MKFKFDKDKCFVIAVSFLIGSFCTIMQIITKLDILDPLLLAIIMGFVIKAYCPFVCKKIDLPFQIVPDMFIPIGAILYGAVNLRFDKFALIDVNYILTLIMISVTCIIMIFLFSSLFKLDEKLCYLLTVGSAICGSSAIAIIIKAIEPKQAHVAISLIAIFIVALLGMMFIMPAVINYTELSSLDQAVLYGSIFQFTGFVSAASNHFEKDIQNLSMSIKALRYIGLLFLVPMFASLSRGKFFVPWYLWAFLCSGIIFSVFPFLYESFGGILKVSLNLLWSTAMAGVGLNSDVRKIFSIEAPKAFCVSLISFCVSIVVFIIGIKYL